MSLTLQLYDGDCNTVKETIANGRFGIISAFGERLDEVQIKLLIALLVP